MVFVVNMMLLVVFSLALGLSGADRIPDHYILATQWPQTVCDMHHGGCYIADNVTAWTIHGLWPDKYEGDDPVNCGGEEFDLDALQPLLSTLLSLWPNVYADSTSASFWKHEWYKHGTCAVAAGDFANQEEYFSAALTKIIRYNGYQILGQAGIGPSDQPLKLDDVLKVLDDTLYYRFNLNCDHDMDTDRFLLYELEVCFNRSMSPIDCYIDDDGTSYHVGGCSKSHDVYYLPIQH